MHIQSLIVTILTWRVNLCLVSSWIQRIYRISTAETSNWNSNMIALLGYTIIKQTHKETYRQWKVMSCRKFSIIFLFCDMLNCETDSTPQSCLKSSGTRGWSLSATQSTETNGSPWCAWWSPPFLKASRSAFTMARLYPSRHSYVSESLDTEFHRMDTFCLLNFDTFCQDRKSVV